MDFCRTCPDVELLLQKWCVGIKGVMSGRKLQSNAHTGH